MKKQNDTSRNDSSVVCMYNGRYYIEQAVAGQRSSSQVLLFLRHKLASRGIDLWEVLAYDEEGCKLGSTDSGIEHECSDEGLK